MGQSDRAEGEPRGREPVCVRRPERSPVDEASAPPNVPEFSSGLRPSCDPGEGGACPPPRAKRGHQVLLAPTPRDTVLRDGTAALYRFRRPARDEGPAEAEGEARTPSRLPLLLIPSMINRWYVLDLREGVSLARSLVDAGFDVWCLDWGMPEDEDRHLAWDEVLDRLARMVRRVLRETGAPKLGLLGYCMGGTLTGIYAALEPERVAAFINLAGPFDFSEGGDLAHMTDPRWFDVDAIADAGNVNPFQMQSGFIALRPTLQVAKWVGFADRMSDPKAVESFEALEAWANDNIPFPASAYRTYIRELYQENLLVQGEHRVRGRRVDLGNIRCPVLTVAAERDTICPVAAARGLNDHVGSEDEDMLLVPGGHVGLVIGSKAPTKLYPAIASWLEPRLAQA